MTGYSFIPLTCFFSFSIYLNGRMMLPCHKFNNVRHAELYNTLNTSYCSCLKCLKYGDWNYTVFEATDKGKIHNFNMSVSFVVWFHCACSHAALIVCVTNCTIRRDSGGDVCSRPRSCSTCRYGLPPPPPDWRVFAQSEGWNHVRQRWKLIWKWEKNRLRHPLVGQHLLCNHINGLLFL